MTSRFTERELAYLQSGEQQLARIATVGADGMPHVVPTGWSYNTEHDTIDIGGIDLTATKKYRDAARSGAAAVVIDDVLPPWRPRGVEIRGRAEIVQRPEITIRIHPTRIVSWGLESEKIGERHSRDLPAPAAPSAASTGHRGIPRGGRDSPPSSVPDRCHVDDRVAQ